MTRRTLHRLVAVVAGPAVAVALLSGGFGQGCKRAVGRLEPSGSRGTARTSNVDKVVSTVGATEITLREVSELVSAGLSPQQSLRRLQSQGVLMGEAERRGFGEGAEVCEVEEQALVQALLAREVDSLSVSEAELRAAYDAQRVRFETPERRLAVHVLAKLAPGSSMTDAQAKDFAVDEIKLLERASDVDAFLAGQRARSVNGLILIAERLPEIAHASVPGAFGDALFALREPGVVKEPVKSRQGWHAVRLLSILKPEVRVPFEQAQETLRPEVLLQKQKQRLDALIADLRERTPVAIAPNARELLGALNVE